MITRDSWSGLICGKRQSRADVSLTAPLGDSSIGGSGSFLALAEDGQRYWVKPLNNYQGERVPITEQIIGRVGAIIDVPTCRVRTVRIGSDLAGWRFRADREISPGIAHGSLHVEDCVETRALEFRAHDDNRHRHCAILALHDWCWGSDAQWLRVERDHERYYSHDHGWYLLPDGPHWTATELERVVDEPHDLADSGLDFGLVAPVDVATLLTRVTRAQLVEALITIPADWPVADEELESVGFFLERRAPQVAARLRTRLGGVA